MAKKLPINTIISILVEPLLIEAAVKVAKHIPEDSLLKTTAAKRTLGAFKGLAEDYKPNGPEGVILKKITQFLNIFSGAIESESKTETDAPINITQNWIQKFWVDTQKTLAETPAEKLKDVRQKLLKDFQIRKEIFQIVSEAEKEYQQPQKDVQVNPINWAELDQKAADWIENHRPTWIKRRPRRNP